MKKIQFTLALTAAFFFANNNFAQAQNAVLGTVEIAKISQPCLTAGYNFNEDLLIETIEKKMVDAKVPKPDKSKGFKIYKGVNYPAFGPEKMDIYIKTDGKKETSTCIVAVSKGYDNFMQPTTDSAVLANVKTWLSNLQADAGGVQLVHDIETQTDNSKKAEKKYNTSVDDGKDYQKDLEKIQRKIEDNKAEQAKLLKEWEDAKSKVVELQAKQKK